MDEINEIMDITEIFIIEKRMMDLTYYLESTNTIAKICLEPSKKLNIHQNQTNGYLKFFTVKGLN